MSRYVLFLTFTLLLAVKGFAQFKISGKVVNDQGQPVGFSEVVLFQKDSDKVATGAATKDDGSFALQAPQGAYRLQVRIFGQAAFEKPLDLAADTNLGTISIDDKTALEEVTVTDQKKLIERKVDRVVFNVENSVAATGGDALDALKVTPRVLVKNEEIEIIGKGEAMVMVDDHLVKLSGTDLAQYLKSLRAEQIKSIEVIPNPPAKYSAEGNAGLINIITKKAKKDTWNASATAGYKQEVYPTGNAALTYNLQHNKLTLASGINAYDGSVAPWLNSSIYYPDQLWKTNTLFRAASKNLSPNISLDYDLSDKISMGASYKLSLSKDDERGQTTDIANTYAGTNDLFLRTAARDVSNTVFNIANYHLVFKPDTLGRKLSLDLDWFKHDNTRQQPVVSDRYLRGGQDFDQTLQAADNQGTRQTANYSVSLDMEHPTKWADLNYGGRLSFTNTDNDFKYYNTLSGSPVLDNSRSNVFLFKENTQALYASAQKSIGKKWTAKVGLRLESTQIEGYSRTLDQRTPLGYTKLFPTAYVAYTPNDNHNLNLSYSRRISRPSFSDYNPFRWTASPYVYQEGNPLLLPSFTHNIELGYTYKIMTNSLYFSYTDNGFQQFTSINPVTKVNEIRPLNFYTTRFIGFNHMTNASFFGWLDVYFSANVGYMYSVSTDQTILPQLDGWSSTLNLYMDFALNKAKTLLINVNQFAAINPLDALYRATSFYQADISLKALALKKQLSITLTGNNLFRSNIYTVTAYSNNQRQLITQYHGDQYVRLSLTYTFGKAFNLNTHQQKNEDEINRMN